LSRSFGIEGRGLGVPENPGIFGGEFQGQTGLNFAIGKPDETG
jgi:hypothetical protein